MVPDDATIRLRLALLLEEFHELAEATCQQPDLNQQACSSLPWRLPENELASLSGFRVDLVEVADALTDINYVDVVVFRHTFGIDLNATCEEVHRAKYEQAA